MLENTVPKTYSQNFRGLLGGQLFQHALNCLRRPLIRELVEDGGGGEI